LIEGTEAVLLSASLFAIFETPLAAVAVGGAAVSIPIVIHLLNRRRFKVVTWAAMRFLLAAQKKNTRRMRLEQLLLLAVRCLLVLMLILAMCSVTSWAETIWRTLNPEGARGKPVTGTRTHKVLVVDASLSMNTKVGDTIAFEKARSLAEQVVQDSVAGDGFSLVVMGSTPRRIIPEPSEDSHKVLAEIKGLKPTHGNSDLAGTLATVANLLKSSPGKFPAKEVYFFTDLQRSTWIANRPTELTAALTVFQERKARALFINVGQDGLTNLAITRLELGDPIATTGRETPILATLHNYGDTREDVSVRLFVGKARATATDKPVELIQADEVITKAERGQSTPVTFKYKFPTTGDYVIQAQINHDALELDDIRSAVVTVKNTVPCLLVNGKPAPELFDRATEWLKTALNPFDEGETIPSAVTARPKIITPGQFADEGLGDLTPYDCVFLCDLPRIGASEVRRLEAFLKRGGGVVISLGKQASDDLGAYNELLYRDGQGILPARLIGKSPEGTTFQFQMDTDADRYDPLKLFRDNAARQRLLSPRFKQFVEVEPVTRFGPRKILNFTPVVDPKSKTPLTPVRGGPAILEWQPLAPRDKDVVRAEGVPQPPQPRLRGRVILITTTLNSDWNNWPTSPAFPPLMQELLHFATASRLREQSATVGDPLELLLPTGASAEAVIHTPDGREETIRPSRPEDGLLRFPDSDVSGVYKLIIGQHPREYLFAVNVPDLNDSQTSESNLTRVTPDELSRSYPEWELQVVEDPRKVTHAVPTEVGGVESMSAPQGGPKARVLLLLALTLALLEVVLAWLFGHYSGTAAPQVVARPPSVWGWQDGLLVGARALLFIALAVLVFSQIHNAFSGDYLSFLPSWARQGFEYALNIPKPAAGEGSHWRLEFIPYLTLDPRTDPWLVGALGILAVAGVALIYRLEGKNVDIFARLLLIAFRVGLLYLLLAALLPQLKIYFERQSWPDVVVLIDDSQSMSTFDVYRDPKTKAAADALAEKADLTQQETDQLAHLLASRPDLTRAGRLRLAQTLINKGNGEDWLTAMIRKRQVRLHVYRCSARAHRIADATKADEVPDALKSINALAADPENDSSQLGAAVRQVLNDFRGSSLAAVVMLTDGVTTEGEELGKVTKYAAQMGVPLYFVGMGDSLELRDVYLHDLQAADAVYVNDNLVFDIKVTAQGYGNLSLPVSLYEKGKDKPIETKSVQLDAQNKTVKVSLTAKPTEPGEKQYVIKVAKQEGEIEVENNVAEKQVFVNETKLIKVLYVEGYRRYEYHYLKTLIERESDRVKGNKSFDIKVLLLDADNDFPAQDRSAIATFPTKEELKTYDVVILGDVDPEPSREYPKMTEHLKDLADFVREKGGGLLMIAGERYAPRAYKNSPLKDVLPIDITVDRPEGDDANLVDTYHPELTPSGMAHPVFRFDRNEKDSDELWKNLRPFFWFAEGYEPKRAAEVLAVHPTVKALNRKGAEERHPLVVQQFSGAGRAMFFGFNETWRWNWREEQGTYNQFWIRTLRYMARSRLGRMELRLDRQTPYRRGEPIKVTVRFPDDAPPPPEKTEVKVVMERRTAGRPGETDVRTINLTKMDGSRATFEALLTQTPEGEYKFWLSTPAVTPKPRAEAKVVAPPGEMERVRMNQSEMEAAAAESYGRFYTLAEADHLIDDLPTGTRVTVNAPAPPNVIWNSTPMFLLVLGLLSMEWVYRKQKNLL
jgi:von Willebrand factor type A domain/Aerotolerance regulator N-terminal